MHTYLEIVFGTLAASLYFVGLTISGVRAMLTQFVLINELGFPFVPLFSSLCFDQLLLANKFHHLDIHQRISEKRDFKANDGSHKNLIISIGASRGNTLNVPHEMKMIVVEK